MSYGVLQADADSFYQLSTQEYNETEVPALSQYGSI